MTPEGDTKTPEAAPLVGWLDKTNARAYFKELGGRGAALWRAPVSDFNATVLHYAAGAEPYDKRFSCSVETHEPWGEEILPKLRNKRYTFNGIEFMRELNAPDDKRKRFMFRAYPLRNFAKPLLVANQLAAYYRVPFYAGVRGGTLLAVWRYGKEFIWSGVLDRDVVIAE